VICTFYSYKGGVGRSMALANVADQLSRSGARVLMIDFDLEAPGLEQFFFRAQEDEHRDAVRRQTGLLDLLLAYKEAMSVARGGTGFRAVERFVAPIFPSRPGGGRLDLMPAGQRFTSEQLSRYAIALRSFDWQDFYFNWEGDLFFEWLRRELVPQRYDLVLIDSRTGVTEMGGICGYQLADTIVMMCGANHQNVDGTWSMLEDFRTRPVEDLRRGRPVEIVVVPARVEQHDAGLLADFHERFEARFASLWPKRLAAAQLSYRDLTVPYAPHFAFEERVARDPHERGTQAELVRVFEQLADAIVLLAPADAPPDGALARLAAAAAARHGVPAASAGAPTGPQPHPTTVAPARYDETRRFARFDTLLCHAPRDADAVRPLRALLERHHVRVAIEATAHAPGVDWRQRSAELLAQSDTLALCLGAEPPGLAQRELLALAARLVGTGNAPRIVSVLLPGFDPAPMVASGLAALPQLDLRDGLDSLIVLAALAERSVPMSAAKAAPAAPVESEERCPWVGSAPYSEHHADLFFGRSAEVSELVGAIETQPCVRLVGDSGCGKTSLLQAGLLPALRSAHPDWAIAVVPTLAEARAALAARPVDRGVFVAVDPDASPIPLPRADRGAAVPTAAVVPLRGLVCLRSDADASVLAEAAACFGAAPAAPMAITALAPPEGLALRALIERPADSCGLAFEPGLVDRLINLGESEPGALPFLQEALLRLWRQQRDGWLTNAAYDNFGTLRGVVTDVAQACHDRFDEGERAEMRHILLRLVQPGVAGTRPTPQRVTRSELLSGRPQAEPVLAALIAARLLVCGAAGGQAVLDLAHESLARDWPPLQVWLEKERDFLAFRARLQQRSKAWSEARETVLRGAPLDEAERVAAERRADLGPSELAYLDASIARRAEDQREADRRRTLKVRGAVATAVVFLVLTVGATVGWYGSLGKGKVLRAQADDLQQQQEALLRQLTNLEEERNASERQRVEAEARLGSLQQTLAQALDTARRAGAERDEARKTVTDLERAVKQADQVAREQQIYSEKRNADLTRQQDALRGVLNAPSKQPYAK